MARQTPSKKHIVPDNWRELFLDSLKEKPIIAHACLAANVSRQFVYDHRHAEPDFARDWDAALAIGMTVLVDVAHERAINISDTLLIFILKHHNPEKYGDKLNLNIKHEDIKNMSDEDLERLAGGG